MGYSKKYMFIWKILQGCFCRDNSLVNLSHGLYYLGNNKASQWSAKKLFETPPNFFERHLCIHVKLHDAKDQAFYLQEKYHLAGGTLSILLHTPHLINSRIMSKFYLSGILIQSALLNQKRTPKCDYMCNGKVAAYEANNWLNSQPLNPFNIWL